MSETIDKTKRPELKVADDLKTSADQLSADVSAQDLAPNLAASTTEDTAAQESSSDFNAGKTPALAAPKPKNASGTPALPEPKQKNASGTPTLPASQLPQKNRWGLARHRLIIGACLSLSLAAIPLGTIDLKALVKRPATIGTAFQIVNKPARPELPPNITYANDEYSEGLISVYESTWNGNVWGFADERGKIVIKPQFAWAGDFHEGLAPAKTIGDNAEVGFIDKTGQWVIKPQFGQAMSFHNGVAEVTFLRRGGALIDKTGRILAKGELGRSSLGTGSAAIGDLFVSCHKGLYGLIDKTGKWVLPAVFDQIRAFDSGYPANNLSTFHRRITDPSKYIQISRNRLWGVADCTGKIIIPPRYDEVLSFQNGHAAVKVDGKYGFVDSNGKTVIKPRYDFVTKFDDLIAVSLDKQWRFIDSSGKLLNLDPVDGVIFDESGAWLSDGYGVIVVNKLCGYMDRTGNIVIPPRFPLATEFREGYALVWDGSLWRFIDKEGNFVSPSFAEVSQFMAGKSSVAVPGPLYSFMAAKELESAKEAVVGIKDQAAPKLPDEQNPEQQGDAD